jgi:hypothetical protein
MPVLNPPSSPQKILVEVPLPQPVGGTTTPSQPATSQSPAPAPRPKKPKPSPFKQIKGPPVMILPHAMEQAAEKMQREGKPAKLAADHETLSSLARTIAEAKMFHGSNHAAAPTGIMADYLRDNGHDNLADHLQNVAEQVADPTNEDVSITEMPLFGNHTEGWSGGVRPFGKNALIRSTRFVFNRGTQQKPSLHQLSWVSFHRATNPHDLAQHSAAAEDAQTEMANLDPNKRELVKMGRFRAPAGGMIVRGQFYPGGKMLPKEATESNPQPNKKTDAKANRKKKKKKKRKKKAVWPSYPMGYRGPFNDDEDEGGDGGAESMRRKGRVRKFAAEPIKTADAVEPVRSVDVKDRKKFTDTIYNKYQGKPMPIDPSSKLAEHFHPDSHNIVAFRDADTGEHFLHGRLSEADGKLHLSTHPIKTEWIDAYEDGYGNDEKPDGFAGDAVHHFWRMGGDDRRNFRKPGVSAKFETQHELERFLTVRPDSSSPLTLAMSGGITGSDFEREVISSKPLLDRYFGPASMPERRRILHGLYDIWEDERHDQSTREDALGLVSKMIDGINKTIPADRYEKMAAVRDLLWEEKDPDKQPEHWKKVIGDFVKAGSTAEPKKLHKSGRPVKFAAESPAPMYPEGTPPIHSVEVKDRKKFSDTLFNKHKGGLVPLQDDSTLAKLHNPESHNLVAFKEKNDDEHFLHGRLVYKGGKVHLHPSDLSKQERDAYDKGYEVSPLEDQEDLLHRRARQTGISIGKRGMNQEERMHALGASDRDNFRPHNHSLRMPPGRMIDPMLGQISRDQQEGLVDQHMRDHDFFGNIGKYDPNGRLNAGEALRSIFNDHIKRGEEKPFKELANHAAEALQAEHEDPEDGVSQHYNTAKKMNEEVGKGNPTNNPDLEPQAWRSHIQAMIDKHLPESGWASKKQGQGKEKMNRTKVKMSADHIRPIARSVKNNLYDDVGHMVFADAIDEASSGHPLAELIRSRAGLGVGHNEEDLGHQSYWDWHQWSNPQNAHSDREEREENGFLARHLGSHNIGGNLVSFWHTPRGGVPHDQKHIVHVMFPGVGHGYTFEMGGKEAHGFSQDMVNWESIHGGDVGKKLATRLVEKPWNVPDEQDTDQYD